MPSRNLRPVAAAAALLLGAVAAADDGAADLAALDLEALMALQVDTVRSASKHEQSIASAPASVTVVTRDEIRDLGYRTLGALLNGVRGLYVTYDRNYSYLGFRGLQRPGDYNTRILLLVDGHATNDPIWDMAAIGPELGLDLDLVDRVEVVRGPGSSMYGGNALFGIVNVITRRAGSLAPAEVAVSTGTLGALGGRASAAIVGETGAEALASVSGADVGGKDLFYPEYAAAGGDGWARGRDWERWGSFLAKAGWRGLSLEVAGARRDKGVPTGAYDVVFADPVNRTSDRRLFAEARVDGSLVPEVDASLRVSYDHYTFGEWYAYDWGAGVVRNEDYNRGDAIGAELKTVSRLGGGWMLVAGAEAHHHLVQELQNRDVGGPTYLDVSGSSSATSLYAQVEAPLAAWLRLVGGARWDRVGRAEALSPRLAVILQPLRDTTVKALFGRAFRPPNFAELNYAAAGSFKTPVGLRPEFIRTYELALEQRVGRGLRLTATAYRYDATRLVDSITDPADGLGMYANSAAVRASGVEAEAHHRWESGVGLRGSWALQRAVDSDRGERISNSPASVGKLQLHGPLGVLHLRGGAELVYMSSRSSEAGRRVPGHLLANLNLRAAGLAGGALDVALGVENVLGTFYGDPASGAHAQDVLRRDGRVFNGTATWSF